MSSPSESIVEAIETLEGAGPEEWDFSIGDYIDLAVIDLLFLHGGECWRFSFQIRDYEVDVYADGTFTVDGDSFTI